MKIEERVFLILFILFNLFIHYKGLYESRYKKNAYHETPLLIILGICVWGDAVIFGLFWVIAGIISSLLNSWILFLLIFSLFWVVRGFGESFYWYLQQFSNINRNPLEKLRGYKFFQNDSIWFIYQIINQCITVAALVVSVYLVKYKL
ncbi:MAG: hypothetical protein UU21_C0024G0017 [Candidatus Levybacteria bacterium GW2011_GWA2_40_8]|nr:MAG: hypothetical protein UU21_C0024G0017 [Candidatus Levybacteria bacterium GW2011_GWA2_40_8]